MSDDYNEFLFDMTEYDPNGFDIDAFCDVVHSHWMYQGLCGLMNWSVSTENSVTQIEIAPPFQIVYGGPEDGKQVWTQFEFDIVGFINEPDVDEITKCGVMTSSLQTSNGPFIQVFGTFRGKEFAMRLHLEPDPGTEPLELIDRIRNEVRGISGEES